MNTEVTGCKDCPFLYLYYGSEMAECICEHPQLDNNGYWGIKYSYTQKEYGYGSLDWCPLKKESITIELKQ